MSRINEGIRSLSPAYFALVMATGIIGAAAQQRQLPTLSNGLFLLNNLAYGLLLLLLLLRLFRFFGAIRADIASHEKGAGFLTLVAATCILGTQYVQGKGSYGAATALWVAGALLWLLLVNAFLSAVVLQRQKPSPETGMSGNWLLLVVATQSLSVLGSNLAPVFPPVAVPTISFAAFLLGIFLYLLLIPIDLYRLIFFPVTPEEVKPSYWINMGAAAISTLAGNQLMAPLAASPDLFSFVPVVGAATLAAWVAATFWIPLLVILECWRYAKGASFRYKPELWSLVFPLGMYAVASGKLGEQLHRPLLSSISTLFFYAAVAAWLLTFIAMLLHLLRRPASKNMIIHDT